MIKLSKREVKEISKASTNGRISAKEYNKIISGTKSSYKNTIEHFNFMIARKSPKEYLFTLVGKHYSTNKLNTISFRERIKYKSSIKEAVKNYTLIHRKEYNEILPKIPFDNVTLYPISFNPKSRDDDGCSSTLKIIRDSIISLGFVKDDKREYLKQMKVDEVLTREYKIEILMVVIS